MAASNNLSKGSAEGSSAEEGVKQEPVVEFDGESLDSARSLDEAKNLKNQEVVDLIISQVSKIEDQTLRNKIEMHVHRLLGTLVVLTEEASREPSRVERIADYLAGAGKLCEKWAVPSSDQQSGNGSALGARKSTRRKIETIEDENGEIKYRFLDDSDDQEEAKEPTEPKDSQDSKESKK